MKVKHIASVVLLIVGLLICFSAAASMDAGASWMAGAVRGAVGIIFMSAGAVAGKDMEFEETEEEPDISEWRDAS